MKDKKIPLRKCVGCNLMKPKTELFCLVRIDGNAVFDPTQKMNGRGAYVCKNEACLDNAVKRKGFNRGLKCMISQEVIDCLYLELKNGSR